MKRSRWFDPYFPPREGKRDTPQMSDTWLSKKSGIYFIRHKATRAVVYVGMSSSQLKKTIYRHFQEWNDRARKALWGDIKRKSYPKQGYEVRFIYCSPTRAAKLEKYFIQKLQPKDNEQKYDAYFGKTEQEQDEARDKVKDNFRKWSYDEDGNEIPEMPKAEYLEEYPF